MNQDRPNGGELRPIGADDAEPVLLTDRFTNAGVPGSIIGTRLPDGNKRNGVDVERVIGIDHGALRIQPLRNPGWGRAGVSYGPYRRRNGLAFGVYMLNGHNTSQAEAIADGFRLRLARWLLGAEVAAPIHRLRQLIHARQRRYVLPRVLQWLRTGTRFRHVHSLDENLAVGWFPTSAPTNPLQQGTSFVMHALGPECGDLRARVGLSWQRVVRGLQNIPVYYVVVLRERGAVYYAASMACVPGLDAYPTMRPLAIDCSGADPEVYAGIHQSVLGQIGFRVDSRVYAAQVAQLPGFDRWFGSAHVADELTGAGDLDGSPLEIGGVWSVQGRLQRGPKGVSVGRGQQGTAIVRPTVPAGLLNVVVETDGSAGARALILWRMRDVENYWCFEAGTTACRVSIVCDGRACIFPATRETLLARNVANTLQVSDDGERIQLYLNGEMVYSTSFHDTRLACASGVGFRIEASSGDLTLRSFEAHPRSVPIPAALDLPPGWKVPVSEPIVEDCFDGLPADIAGRRTSKGDRVWARTIGVGRIELDGSGAAQVHGSVERPCPGRTAYTIEWDAPGFADVEVSITPPGTNRGQRERGRGGLIFWQDPDCYVTLSVFVDDWYGTSIAAFFHVDGFEELYDAVWTNVGKRIRWGVAYDFRVAFDGSRFLAYVDGEPVLYRALSDIYPDWDRMDIRRVGMVVNWEWGNDTGTAFRNFVARGSR